jgi:tRNA A37 threonylcarbamoyladenosine biosynthesis protein TsaE
LYRLDTPEQVAAARLDEYLEPAGVTVIEWAERLFGVQNPKSKIHSPARASSSRWRWVEITATSETGRRIVYEDIGA